MPPRESASTMPLKYWVRIGGTFLSDSGFVPTSYFPPPYPSRQSSGLGKLYGESAEECECTEGSTPHTLPATIGALRYGRGALLDHRWQHCAHGRTVRPGVHQRFPRLGIRPLRGGWGRFQQGNWQRGVNRVSLRETRKGLLYQGTSRSRSRSRSSQTLVSSISWSVRMIATSRCRIANATHRRQPQVPPVPSAPSARQVKPLLCTPSIVISHALLLRERLAFVSLQLSSARQRITNGVGPCSLFVLLRLRCHCRPQKNMDASLQTQLLFYSCTKTVPSSSEKCLTRERSSNAPSATAA
eukprot:scaffold803_cov310-Pinguiococcus_pyrenoidosus.AAC.21